MKATATRRHPARLLWIACLLGAGILPVQAQTLVDLYDQARFERQAARILAQQGLRPAALPPAHVASPSDTIRLWILQFNPELQAPPPVEEAPRFVVKSWRLIRKLERGWFEKQFKDTPWAYVGSNRLTPLDTMYTRELRARMEARFGAPTQTLTELDVSQDIRKEEYIQFEYWFVLNDTIPLIVMDVNGPFERGLVVAGDGEHREILADIKFAFLNELTQASELAPYVDYYYHVEQRAWYRTGYDGASFFARRIARPNLARGRPLLREVDTNE